MPEDHIEKNRNKQVLSSDKVKLSPSSAFLQEIAKEQAGSSADHQQAINPSLPDQQNTKPSFEQEYQSIYPELKPKPINGDSWKPSDQSVGSQRVEKLGFFDGVPKGVIVIVVLTILGALSYLLFGQAPGYQNGNGGVIMASIIGVMLALGLLFGSNICRMLFMIFAFLTAMNAFLGLFQVTDLRQKRDILKEKFSTEITQLEEKTNKTNEDKNDLEEKKNAMRTLEGATDASFVQLYVLFTFNMAYSIFVLSYLFKSSVKNYYGQ